jgi:hypothetical protein
VQAKRARLDRKLLLQHSTRVHPSIHPSIHVFRTTTTGRRHAREAFPDARVRLSFSEGFGRRFADLGHRRPAHWSTLCFVWRPQLALCLAYHLFISATGRVHRRPTGRRACRVLSVSVLIFFSSMGISSCLVGHRRLGPVNSDGHQRRADRRSFWKEYLPLMYGDHGDTDNGGLFSNSIDCGFVACFPVAPSLS